MIRYGIFGGSFSPPHLGHLAAASAFLAEMRLDRLTVIPASIPPHKSADGLADARHRLAMCRLAFEGVRDTDVSDLEINRTGKSYTYLTLRELTRSDRELFFLCGTDMALTLDGWAMPDEIFRLARIVVAPRLSDEATDLALREKIKDYERKYRARVTVLSNPVREISSTEIRAMIASGKSTDQVLDPRIRSYIETWKLYRPIQTTPSDS